MPQMGYEVLVLNSDYEPLNICNVRRAINLVLRGKVEVIHERHLSLHSKSHSYRSPSVIRLTNYVRRPRPQLKLSRKSILARDNYTCQYCGYSGVDLTVDHIVPKHSHGPTSWENLVCCCRKCNSKKGGKSSAQSGMHPKTLPRKPRYVPFISLTKFVTATENEEWRDYLPVFTTPDREFARS
jgi:5-methylcytosine-specific restriction endonuclease McrA